MSTEGQGVIFIHQPALLSGSKHLTKMRHIQLFCLLLARGLSDKESKRMSVRKHTWLSAICCARVMKWALIHGTVYIYLPFYMSVRILNVKEMYSRFMFLLFYILNKYIKRWSDVQIDLVENLTLSNFNNRSCFSNSTKGICELSQTCRYLYQNAQFTAEINMFTGW